MAADLFEDDRSWLRQQPGMTSWKEGCARLRGQMESWLDEYSTSICGDRQAPTQAVRPVFIKRLWECWRHHWNDALSLAPDGKADGGMVAHQIRQGRGFKKNGQLGGDPLRDVVLAQAIQLKDERALALFTEEFQAFIVTQLRRFQPGQDPTPCWNDLLIELGGYLRPPGKLARYSGACALRHWLRTVAQRWFLSRRKAERPQASLDEMAVMPADNSTEQQETLVVTPECLRLFKQRVADTLMQLSPRDRLLLLLRFSEGMQGKDIAGVVGIAPGNVSRALEKALLSLREALEELPVQTNGGQRAFQDCLAHLLDQDQRRSFGEMLLEALKESPVAGPVT
jgi:RNA polymerase sigma factor (sigma-70 family)